MANSKQARKRAIQAVARNKHLSAQRSRYRTAIKNVRKAILAGDKAAAQTLYVTALWLTRVFFIRTPLLVIRAAWLLLSRQWPNQSFLLCFTLKQSKDSKSSGKSPGLFCYIRLQKTIGKNINCLIIFDSSL